MTARTRAADLQLLTVRRPQSADCPLAWYRVVPFDLARCMRRHGVTVRELAERWEAVERWINQAPAGE